MAAQVDRCTVKREQVIRQPAGCYGGWITSWVAALDQPHVHKQPPVDLAVEVERNHMRAVQPRGRMGFTTEPLERLHLIGMLCEDVVEGDGL